MSKTNDWIQTYSGKKFFVHNPNEEDIDIEDIAHALSMTCRFAGHCIRYYTVAEHSYLMSLQFSDPKIALDALLHDATETYLTDMPRPIKRTIPIYSEIEESLCKVIYAKYNLQYPIHAEVKLLDNRMLVTEANQNMKTPPDDWNLPFEPLDIELQYYAPDVIEKLFLDRFYELTKEIEMQVTPMLG